ncbi:MAG TPA: succinyl-diaminopimelate desuccinylase [Caulobacteraceae bacterium]|jgi:succinyl-diaminopimelate desuccinylase|nr:succinyl-diaminopimelate desuccinylase [Caulobacteraceae bacterium]
MPIDPVALAQDLIRRPSVTPADAGAMDVLQAALEALDFRCHRMRFGEIENLYARRGEAGPNLCFAGHTDVVPVGDEAAWRQQPFEAKVVDNVLFGRGAVDMKGAIAAFVVACAEVDPAKVTGSLSLLITGDEEGDADDGTVRVVEALRAEGERIDHCVLGEPSSAAALGDQMKIGRRGSLNAWIEVEGVQGHVAYPHLAANPLPPLISLLGRLQSRVLDEGYPGFQASNLEATTIDVGNPATNVIPAKASARLNIRFNPHHDGETLAAWLETERAAADAAFAGSVRLRTKLTGNAFLTEPGDFVEVCAGAVREVAGRDPELCTTGGISDARFIRSLCPVVELGLVNATMHAVDERAPVSEIRSLAAIYQRLIERYFEAFG